MTWVPRSASTHATRRAGPGPRGDKIKTLGPRGDKERACAGMTAEGRGRDRMC